MTVRIDTKLCNGCPGRQEGCCEEICPGDLFYREGGKCCLREAADCWDCFACVKACPRAALSVELPFQISPARHRLYARQRRGSIYWNIRDTSGRVIAEFKIQNKMPGQQFPPEPQKKRKEAHD